MFDECQTLFEGPQEKLWDACSAMDGSPLLTWDWQASAAEVYAKDSTLKILRSGPHDAPTGLAAFYETSLGYPVWRLLGGIDLGECPVIPAQDDDAAEALADQIAALKAPVDLGHHPSACRVLAALRRRRDVVVLARPMEEVTSPIVWLGKLPEDPLDALSPGTRKSLRRRERKAEARHGAVSVEVVCPGPEAVEAPLSEFIRIEAAGWKGRMGTSLSQDADQMAFYRAYAARTAAKGQLRLAFLKLGGQVAAAQIAVETETALGRTFWALKTGYDEAFAEASPGRHLDLALLAHLRGTGVARVVYKGKEEPWLGPFMENARALEAVRVLPKSAKGLWALGMEVKRAFARRFGTVPRGTK